MNNLFTWLFGAKNTPTATTTAKRISADHWSNAPEFLGDEKNGIHVVLGPWCIERVTVVDEIDEAIEASEADEESVLRATIGEDGFVLYNLEISNADAIAAK